jgi:hypothetical protein
VTKEELDLKCRDLAKRIDEASIDDFELTKKLLDESEELRLEFVKLYGLDDE